MVIPRFSASIELKASVGFDKLLHKEFHQPNCSVSKIIQTVLNINLSG